MKLSVDADIIKHSNHPNHESLTHVAQVDHDGTVHSSTIDLTLLIELWLKTGPSSWLDDLVRSFVRGLYGLDPHPYRVDDG